MRRARWAGQLGEALDGWCGVLQPAQRGEPTVLALHGFTGTSLDWCAVHQQLPTAWGWIAPDLPGHGRTPWTALGTPSLDGLADALADALAKLPRPRVLLGYSLGGRVALTLATRHPAAIDALATLGASAGLKDPAAARERAAADDRLAAGLERDGVPRFLRRWNAGPLFDGQRGVAPALRARSHAHRRAADPRGLAAALRALSTGRMRPLHAVVRDLSMPCVFMAGAHDLKFTALAADLALATPRGQFCAVPDALHAAHLEQPGAVAGALVSLVGRLRSG